MSTYSETQRKLAHVIIVGAVGGLSLALPLGGVATLLLLGSGVYLLLALSGRLEHILRSPRLSRGPGLLFVGLLTLTLLHWRLDISLAWGYALWMLGVGDVVSMLVGRAWSRRRGTNKPKTLAGSGALVACGVVFLLASGVVWSEALLVAAGLGLVEYWSRYGSDNVTLPLGGYFSVWLLT